MKWPVTTVSTKSFNGRLDWIETTPIVILAALLLTATAAAAEEGRPRRFIYNNDGSNIFIYKETPMTPEDVYQYVDEVAGTQVTTLSICPNWGMPLMYPSQVTEMIGSTLDEEGWSALKQAATKPGQRSRGVVNLHSLVDAGHDPIGLVVERARKKNLETFITFRVNEIHEVQDPKSILVTKFWRDHPEWRVGKPGDELQPVFKEILGGREDYKVNPIVGTWFSGALNFSVPEVRALRLAELRECCERYPIDGIDLDFQRFPIYFPQGESPEHVATMTSWVREVRKMTREVGANRGRPMLLSARVLAKPEQNLAIGLDPISWAKEGVVDFLVISHYLRNDFPLPIAAFRSGVQESFPIYGSIEVEHHPDNVRRIARQLWDDGADGILLFNFFTSRELGKEPPFELLNELGDANTIRRVGSVAE